MPKISRERTVRNRSHARNPEQRCAQNLSGGNRLHTRNPNRQKFLNVTRFTSSGTSFSASTVFFRSRYALPSLSVWRIRSRICIAKRRRGNFFRAEFRRTRRPRQLSFGATASVVSRREVFCPARGERRFIDTPDSPVSRQALLPYYAKPRLAYCARLYGISSYAGRAHPCQPR